MPDGVSWKVIAVGSVAVVALPSFTNPDAESGGAGTTVSVAESPGPTMISVSSVDGGPGTRKLKDVAFTPIKPSGGASAASSGAAIQMLPASNLYSVAAPVLVGGSAGAPI
jgi:hypothetical protein